MTLLRQLSRIAVFVGLSSVSVLVVLVAAAMLLLAVVNHALGRPVW